ncbi:MAG: AAA family ATPase [Oscillospiraceae bacterium]|nr:AAA family ATPase [Oscillospiraceae bacterium]
MKKLIIVNGTMGVGKTATCRALQALLPANVFLDGDWCWDARPFVVTDETKEMALDNIVHLLNSFLRCSAYENIIFCWVLHEPSILDALCARLDTAGCAVRVFTLVCGEAALRDRLARDVAASRRTADVIGRSAARLPLYDAFENEKLDVTEISAEQAAAEIAARLPQ